ncbi:hypothetical protein LshimejAT787_0602800 [Lyophyllum shimeji]|uniref:Uncharacterized protein n=1 Tax=Lyophyllum shimeji TaxID=47721 RepID=A0A9P3PNH3_LYOSH|nr:hypothetical protein LshimejAT787_0602800 [Lyophyllum shimeji]
MTRRGALIDQESDSALKLNEVFRYEELQTAFSELDTLDWHTACGDEVTTLEQWPKNVNNDTMERSFDSLAKSFRDSGTLLF